MPIKSELELAKALFPEIDWENDFPTIQAFVDVEAEVNLAKKVFDVMREGFREKRIPFEAYLPFLEELIQELSAKKAFHEGIAVVLSWKAHEKTLESNMLWEVLSRLEELSPESVDLIAEEIKHKISLIVEAQKERDRSTLEQYQKALDTFVLMSTLSVKSTAH